MKLIPPILLMFALLTGCSSFDQNQRKSAKEVESFTHREGVLTIFSLDPNLPDEEVPDAFHRYRVLGRTVVTNAGQKEDLLRKLAESIRRNEGEVAACFNPRHGLRFEADGKQVDMVICFECRSADVYGSSVENFLLTGHGKAEFDAVLTGQGIPPGEE
ncbi:MAG: hypothetical protein KF712_05080 [Akkermansiaceae bacterium]|nr:hypothetical protein [Akkermansiaceae bacterium]